MKTKIGTNKQFHTLMLQMITK